MISLVNPRTARLGISTFWTVNYLPTLRASYYPQVEKRKYQHYIESLEKYFDYFFIKKLRKIFYRRFYYVYYTFKFNAYGFPGVAGISRSSDTQHFRLDIYLYDFYMHIYYGMNLRFMFRRILSPELRSFVTKVREFKRSVLLKRKAYLNFLEERNKQTFKRKPLPPNYDPDFGLQTDIPVLTDRLLRYNKQLSLTIKFIKNFVLFSRIIKQHLEVYLRKFKFFLRAMLFRARLMRIHNYFFNGIPLKCILHIVPYHPSMITARFLCKFIERQLKQGRFVKSVVNVIYKFLQRNKVIKGLRIICSGRFVRGKKGAVHSRVRGFCTFGAYNIWTNKSYTIDYAETKCQLRAGMCGFRIWVCKWKRKWARAARPGMDRGWSLKSKYSRNRDFTVRRGRYPPRRKYFRKFRRRFLLQR